MPESSNTGGRKPRVSDRDLLAVFRSTTDPVLSTAEVADAVPIKRRGVLNRLRDLEDAGELASKQIGGRNTVWWILDRRETGEDAARADAVDDATDGRADPPTDAHGAETGFSTDNLQGDADTTLDELAEGSDGIDRDAWRARLADTLAGSGALADRRADAILNMYDHLREHGAATNDELRAVVDADAVGYKDAGSVWANMVKGKDTLRTLPGVEKPAPGRNDPWRYDAEEEL